MKFNLKAGCKSLIGTTKKHSPELLLVGGIASGVAAVALACKATWKVRDIVDTEKEIIDEETEYYEEAIEYASENANTDEITREYEDGIKEIKKEAAVEIVKSYIPSALLGIASISAIVASNGILIKRNASLAATCTAISKMYKDYRQNVVKMLGEEMDQKLKYGIMETETEETFVDKNGKEKTKKVKKEEMTSQPGTSDYARRWGRGYSSAWDESESYNMTLLDLQEKYLNDQLQAEGRLFLNDVYTALGYKETETGHNCGWLKNDPLNLSDDYVKFNKMEIKTDDPFHKDYMLDFNCVFIADRAYELK